MQCPLSEKLSQDSGSPSLHTRTPVSTLLFPLHSSKRERDCHHIDKVLMCLDPLPESLGSNPVVTFASCGFRVKYWTSLSLMLVFKFLFIPWPYHAWIQCIKIISPPSLALCSSSCSSSPSSSFSLSLLYLLLLLLQLLIHNPLIQLLLPICL